MATIHTFDGKRIVRPGVYSRVTSGIQNPPIQLPFGAVLVIDKDGSNEFGGGASINGEFATGKDSIYSFQTLREFRSFVRGGEMWDFAQPLFRPAGVGFQGVPLIYYVRAQTTTAAGKTLTWTGGGANGGSLTFKTQHEGFAGNAAIDETRAIMSFEVDIVGGAADTFTVEVDPGTGDETIALYTATGGESTADVALAIVEEINDNSATNGGYTAQVGSDPAYVEVFAPVGVGVAGNSYTTTITPTGTFAWDNLVDFAGAVDGSILTQGVSVTMEAGKVDTAKFILKFWRGTYTGLHTDGFVYDGIAAAATEEQLLAQTPEFNNVQEVIDWAANDFGFNAHLKLTASSVAGTGVVDAADLAATVGHQPFFGATQSYNTARIDEVLTAVKDLDFTFIFSTDGGSNAQSADNGKLATHVISEGKYRKYVVIGGGDTKNEFTSQSLAACTFWDTERVITVHGGMRVASTLSGAGYREKSAVYKAAAVLGRIAGNSPQTPVTFKGIQMFGERHTMTDQEITQAIEGGLCCTAWDPELQRYVVQLGVNTLQDNLYLVNSVGKSHLIQVEMINHQLLKELEFNAKIQLLGDQYVGPNRATLTKDVVKAWVKNYLLTKTASATVDNLILGFQDVTVTVQQDAYYVEFSYIPNFEVNKLFVTGLIIDPNL